MTSERLDLVRLHQARELANDALENAAGRPHHQGGGTFLATSFAQRSDLPVTASIRRMSGKVAKNLSDLGMHEPVSLRMLPGRWWITNIDAAEVGMAGEYGCGYVTRTLSSEQLATLGYEVIDGPFEAWANTDVSRAMLRGSPGKFWDATVSNRPLLTGAANLAPYSGYDSAYTSEALLAALEAGKSITVYGGPYGTEEDARYALDLRWESPE